MGVVGIVHAAEIRVLGASAIEDYHAHLMRLDRASLFPGDDRSVDAHVKAAEKADRSDVRQVAAPFAGVISLKVAEGDSVEAGQTIASIEAMKMEAAITAPVAGTVQRLAIGEVQQVEGGDLLVVLR